ncbi:MAG: hypothetical protein HRT66_10020 [Flavobacteriaceae bacterium]|nr:hypothetical protein [Flavobacteriaceae bacterium]
MFKQTIFIITLLIINISNAQNHVFDYDTNESIESVHIKYLGNRGSMTNEDGYFELPSNISIDSIYISHIAYKLKKILFKNLVKNDTIFLYKENIYLDEVALNNFNAKDIVTKAINKINDNYLSIPYNSFGFFRQILEEGSKGVEMIEVDFMSYTKRKKNKNTVKIKNAKRTENHSKFKTEVISGVLDLIKDGDFINNRRDPLNISNLDDYEFEYMGEFNYENSKAHKIYFNPIDDDNIRVLRKGMIYIESKSLAIIEIDYKLDEDKLNIHFKKADFSEYNKRPRYFNVKTHNIIRYRKVSNDKWVLSYIKASNTLKGIYKGNTLTYKLTGKLVINDIKTKKPKRIKTNYKLEEDFSKAVKKYDKLDKWDDTYKLSLSDRERQILKDIDEKSNNSK